MKRWEINFYWESGRVFSRWIGMELQHKPDTKIWYAEFGFLFFYLSVSYDGEI